MVVVIRGIILLFFVNEVVILVGDLEPFLTDAYWNDTRLNWTPNLVLVMSKINVEAPTNFIPTWRKYQAY